MGLLFRMVAQYFWMCRSSSVDELVVFAIVAFQPFGLSFWLKVANLTQLGTRQDYGYILGLACVIINSYRLLHDSVRPSSCRREASIFTHVGKGRHVVKPIVCGYETLGIYKGKGLPYRKKNAHSQANSHANSNHAYKANISILHPPHDCLPSISDSHLTPPDHLLLLLLLPPLLRLLSSLPQ